MSDTVNANPDSGASTESNDFDAVSLFEQKLDKEPSAEASHAPQQQAAPETPPSEQPQEQAKAEPEGRVYKVKVNGQEIEVPESELIAGYQRDKDYRVKTEQLGEQRRAVDVEQQKAQQERAQLAQQLQAYLTLPMQVQPPDPALIDADPVAYLKQQQAYEQEIFKRQQGQHQLAALHQQAQADQQQQLHAHLQNEQTKLLEAIPDWKNPETAKAEQKAMRDYLAQSGFQEQEINSIADHRAVSIARKAMLYDQMVAQANAAAKQVRSAPPKVERPGAATQDTRATDGRTEAMKTLKRSGSTDAAASVFERML